MKLLARVPATSANLGPGFDCLGLALALHNEVELDTEAPPGVSWEGEGADQLPTDGSDMVSAAIRWLAAFHEMEIPSFHLHGVNRIPLERGLGSSSAAAVAGVILGDLLLDLGISGRPEDVWSIAADIEGHPDNAAPCTYGGFTIASPPNEGPPVRLDPHPDIHPVALIPTDVRLPTAEARRALPRQVPLADAVFNLARTAQAVVAFTQDPSLLMGALSDRLHQDVRLALVPAVQEVFRLVRRARIPVCVSGAGPTLLAFPPSGLAIPDLGPGWEILPLAPEPRGAKVSAV